MIITQPKYFKDAFHFDIARVGQLSHPDTDYINAIIAMLYQLHNK